MITLIINSRLLLINIKGISPIKQVILTGALMLATLIGFSQNVGISAAGAPADNSAGLDVSFTNKGLLIPRVSLTSTTDIATITTPATSLLVYNINAGMVGGSIGYWYWDGSIWMKLGGGAASMGWSLTGNASTTAGTNFIGTTDAQDFAIYTNNAERMRVLSGGNVGIGITSPKRLLHVSQNSSGTPSIFALDNVNTTDGNGLNISFRGTTTGVGAASFKEFATIQAKYETHEEAIRASSLIFFTCVNGLINERMRINTDGYLGIGNSNPSNKLHVTSVSNPIRLEGLQTGDITDQIMTVDPTGVVRKQSADSIAALSSWGLRGNAGTTAGANFIGTTDAQDLAIYTNNAERMRVKSSGNVGIGTANPQRLVHVVQNSTGTPSMFALDNTNTSDGNGLCISFRGTTTGAGATSFKEFVSLQASYDTHESSMRASSLRFLTSANGYLSEKMRINTEGNVGIRTSAPNSYLDVAGSFATAITKTTGNLTLDERHYTVIVTGGTPAITLPVAGAANSRRSYRIINQNSSAITISSYIDFTGSAVLTVPGNSKIEVQSDGANWYRVD